MEFWSILFCLSGLDHVRSLLIYYEAVLLILRWVFIWFVLISNAVLICMTTWFLKFCATC